MEKLLSVRRTTIALRSRQCRGASGRGSEFLEQQRNFHIVLPEIRRAKKVHSQQYPVRVSETASQRTSDRRSVVFQKDFSASEERSRCRQKNSQHIGFPLKPKNQNVFHSVSAIPVDDTEKIRGALAPNNTCHVKCGVGSPISQIRPSKLQVTGGF